MAILVHRHTKAIVCGITGRQGRFHTEQCLAYGTQIVAGVTPGKGGQQVFGVPVFDSVGQALEDKGPVDAALIFVPPLMAADSILECADAGIPLIIAITEGIPVLDLVSVNRILRQKGVRLVGPNCPGIITPGECKLGIMPASIHQPGFVGVVSRSGTLTYEAVYQLTRLGLGQSTCVGIGGDPIPGTNFVEVLDLFEKDPQTKAVVLIGEIGGSAEEEAAHYIRQMTKPVVAFIAGASAPKGRRMGHAGAIITGGQGDAAHKYAALEAAGVTVCRNPARIGQTVYDVCLQKGILSPGR